MLTTLCKGRRGPNQKDQKAPKQVKPNRKLSFLEGLAILILHHPGDSQNFEETKDKYLRCCSVQCDAHSYFSCWPLASDRGLCRALLVEGSVGLRKGEQCLNKGYLVESVDCWNTSTPRSTHQPHSGSRNICLMFGNHSQIERLAPQPGSIAPPNAPLNAPPNEPLHSLCVFLMNR